MTDRRCSRATLIVRSVTGVPTTASSQMHVQDGIVVSDGQHMVNSSDQRYMDQPDLPHLVPSMLNRQARPSSTCRVTE